MVTKLPHEIKSEETKQKILDTTRTMLEEYGFRYLTVRNICAESGVAYGSFYHHFASKENLLFLYTEDLYKDVYQKNPLPAWIDADDFIKCIIWYVAIYGEFCEMLGKKLIRYLYENCSQDLFAPVFEKDVLPLIRKAIAEGYTDPNRDRDSEHLVDEIISKDLRILCKGVVFWWCSTTSENTEPLSHTLEHMVFNMLYAFSSEKYKEANFRHVFITSDEPFDETKVIEGISIKDE